MRNSKFNGLKILAGLTFLVPTFAHAHVKWFSKFSYDQAPQDLSELNHFSFWALGALSVVTIALIVYLDRVLENWAPYQKLNQKLRSYESEAPVILRVFTGASLLLAWQADSIIAPELKITAPIVGWYQFALCLLLLGRFTSAIAGGGMILLYFFAITQYGKFHLLDYLIYPAIGYFLLVSQSTNTKLKSSRVPALYIGLGFSLCWAALEKISYPNWGLEVLDQAPALTMGLPKDFFLLSCAFVELSLGYLLIIGLIQRPLALTITLVFFTTTAFFGKTEIVGHILLHGALLVFIVLGKGDYYKPPITFHKQLGLRMAFAAVNFIIVVGVLTLAYHALSRNAYEHRVTHDHAEAEGA